MKSYTGERGELRKKEGFHVESSDGRESVKKIVK